MAASAQISSLSLSRSPRRRLAVPGLALTGTLALIGAGLIAPLPAYAASCIEHVSSDFNGDGYADAAVADPYATVGGISQAGRVVIRYGDADERIGEGTVGVVSQGSGVVGDAPESGDRFGYALASADLDGDGCHDLVVGSPYEDNGSAADSGSVQVVWGDPAGLGAGTASRQLSQSTFGQGVHAGDQFGYAVDALDDVTQGGTPEPDAYTLAVGAPGFDVSGKKDAGWVGFLSATDGGNVAMDATQDTPGIAGAAEAGDRFGAAVSLNYLTSSAGFVGVVDGAVGVPGEDVGSVVDAGAVMVLTDLYDQVENGGVLFDQNSPGVPGAAEAGDQLGRSLDTVRVGSTTHLVAGVPGEDVGSKSNAGMVQLFRSPKGTGVTPSTGLTQDSPGVSGAAEGGDLFGDDVALVPPGPGNSTARLAVSAPAEDGSAVDSGGAWVFPINDLDGETVYTQGSPGMPGDVDAGDRFGSSLAAVRGVSETALLIGVPADVDLATGMVDVLPMGGGTPRYWAPGVGGVPAGGANRFGDALASSSD